ncbi:hypothetical protein QT971_10945 [Microcoleus sp. herbarium19]|uniref:hypothetical protein n=1 Tax=unclassified Microcoleus TaxID=2642155 RepID=UPI002FD47436
MPKQENQQPQVSLETPSQQALVEEPAVAAEELPINVNSETLSQVFENTAKDRLNALGRLMIVSVTWTLAELSKRK